MPSWRTISWWATTSPRVAGYGMNHGNVETFPRLADVLGFIPADKVNAIGRAVIVTQRDYGDRTNRRHARLKYTIEDRGVAWFKSEVERLSGVAFEPARPFHFSTIEDPLGWHKCADGTWFYGLHILSGRIKDLPGWPMKTALREIAQVHTGDFRLSPSQNLSISGVSAAQKPMIEAILAKHGLTRENKRSGLRLNALSCVALPTCGLALAESERVLPDILSKFEAVLEEAGLTDDAISLRITGCPNGCARPFLAEIGFVGRAPNKYALYLGASYNGTRLGRLVSPSITIDDALKLLTPVIKRYALERDDAEGFGDFCDRVILPEDATIHSVGTPTEDLDFNARTKMTPEQIAKWNAELRHVSPLEITRWAVSQADGRAIVSTNFRPYEAVILHLAVQVQPRIPVLWVDHGYNRPATYRHAEELRRLLNLDIRAYLPRISAAHRDAIYGPIPSTEDEEGLKEFSALMKLEPFQRGMKELAPTSLDHGAAQGPKPESRRTRHRLARRQFRHPEGQPGVLSERRRDRAVSGKA